MPFKEKYFQHQGVKIRYWEKGEGEALLFLHGTLVEAFSYKEILNLLSFKYKVYAPDLPCFGGSDVPGSIWDYGDFTKYLDQFITFLPEKKILVIGHSLGANLALELALINRKVSGIVVISAAEGLADYPRIQVLYNLLVKKTIRDIFLYKKPALLFLIARDVLVNLIKKLPRFGNLWKILTGLLEMDFSRFYGLGRPALFIWGKSDEVCPLEAVQRLQKKIAGSTLEIVQGNHDWCFFNPVDLKNKIDNWIRALQV